MFIKKNIWNFVLFMLVPFPFRVAVAPLYSTFTKKKFTYSKSCIGN